MILENILKKEPLHEIALVYLSNCFYFTVQYDKDLLNSQKLLKLFPNDYLYHNNIAALYNRLE